MAGCHYSQETHFFTLEKAIEKHGLSWIFTSELNSGDAVDIAQGASPGLPTRRTVEPRRGGTPR